MEPISINRHMYDRGRGPELRRVRITVYDLLPYLLNGSFSDEQILTDIFRMISAEELAALKKYIDEHRDEVMAVHEQINERNRIMREQTAKWHTENFGNTDGRAQNFSTWLRVREQEAARGGSPLPVDTRERLREYTEWWQVHCSGIAEAVA